MPRQVKDIKIFIQYSRRKDASAVRIKVSTIKPTATSKKIMRTKFKLRCKRNLYTLVLDDAEKASKLRSSLPPGLKVEEVDTKRKK